MTRAAALALALVVAALLGAADGAAVQAQNPKLFGTVGPEFEISFRDGQGGRVTKLEPGTYDIQVRDLSDFHTFHLDFVSLRPASDARGQVRRRDAACYEPASSVAGDYREDQAAPDCGTAASHYPEDRGRQSGQEHEARHIYGHRP